LIDNPEGITDIKALKSSAFEVAKKLEETLQSFGVDAKVINISRGPAVTRYELQPSPGVKVSKIVNLSDDISLNLAASGVRIEHPYGKGCYRNRSSQEGCSPVYLKEVLNLQSLPRFIKFALGLGKDISGKTVVADIARMPHMLIAGATGSGKSVCINSIIVSLLYKSSPDDVKLLMVDPKVVELGIYNGIPHLLIPVVTDPRKAAGALNWAVQEMVNRYKLFAEKGVRDIKAIMP
jgi:S-DNA-T family DNA segregation ATPase FtsK/SpoIIIE